MTNTVRTRSQEANGFRMTNKRKEAIAKAQSMGIELDTSIFLNPLTRMMGVDELIEFSQSKVVPNTSSMAFATNIVKIRDDLDVQLEQQKEEDFAEIEKKVKAKFALMEELVLSTVVGLNPSLFLSGAAGVGKSTTVMNVIENTEITTYKLVKGKLSTGGLFALLYEYRHEGCLLVFDDSDSVFEDEDKMNILKACTDSSKKRTVSWHTSREIFTESGEEVPSDFEFKGSIIFASNYDIYKEAAGNGRLAPHFQALISRSFVLDLAMPTANYYLARIKDVLFNHMNEDDFKLETKHEIYEFMVEHKDVLRELSLRMVNKMGIVMKTYGSSWKEKAKILFCK